MMGRKLCNEYSLTILLLVICVLCVNNWSLWLDESSTACLASIPTFQGFIDKLSVWQGSESQMPLYIGSMWAWEKIFGHTEYALRFFNVFIVLIGLAYCTNVVKRIENPDSGKLRVTMALMVISPFFIYNMNEARVNISLCILSALCYMGMFMYCKAHSKCDLYICIIALIVGCGFNMLFYFIAPVALALGLYFDKKFISNNKNVFIVTVIGCVGIGCYYAWTLMQSKGGAIEKTGVFNIVYALYEFMGFNGMGAPKNELRESNNILITVKPYIPWMLTLCVGYALLVWRMIVERTSIKTLYLFALGLAFFLLGAYIASFRFWGRHLFIFYPLWIYALASVIYDLWNSKQKINKAVVLFFILMIAISSVRISCKDEYKKENVKETISFVNKISDNGNTKVFFAGFDELANYYGLKNCHSPNKMYEADKGILVFIKSMKVYYGGTNIFYQPEKYKYKLLRSNSTSDIYQFIKK